MKKLSSFRGSHKLRQFLSDAAFRRHSDENLNRRYHRGTYGRYISGDYSGDIMQVLEYDLHVFNGFRPETCRELDVLCRRERQSNDNLHSWGFLEKKLGLPEWFLRVALEAFKRLPYTEPWPHAYVWPAQLLSAIPVGRDMNPILGFIVEKKLFGLTAMLPSETPKEWIARHIDVLDHDRWSEDACVLVAKLRSMPDRPS